MRDTELEHPTPIRTDRRVATRHACQIQVDYRAAQEWRRATAMDVSPRGCRLRLGESLSHGGVVWVRFRPAASPDAAARTVSVEGRVVWTRLEGLSYQAGLHFAEDSAELAELIASLA